jgi:hypothetical protein
MEGRTRLCNLYLPWDVIACGLRKAEFGRIFGMGL